jgi:hypothetical protein
MVPLVSFLGVGGALSIGEDKELVLNSVNIVDGMPCNFACFLARNILVAGAENIYTEFWQRDYSHT